MPPPMMTHRNLDIYIGDALRWKMCVVLDDRPAQRLVIKAPREGFDQILDNVLVLIDVTHVETIRNTFFWRGRDPDGNVLNVAGAVRFPTGDCIPCGKR